MRTMPEYNISTRVYHPVGEGIHISPACTQVHFIPAGYMLVVSSFCSAMKRNNEYITTLSERVDHPGCCVQVIETVTAKIGSKGNQSIAYPILYNDHRGRGIGTCIGYTMAFKNPFCLPLPGGTKIIGMVIGNADHVKSSIHETVNIMVGHPEHETLGGIFAFFRVSDISRKGSLQVSEGDICIPEDSVYII